MEKTGRRLLDAAWYLMVFIIIEVGVSAIAAFFCQTHALTPTVQTVTALVSSVATIAVFAWRRWSPYSGAYINTRPWFTLFWVACLAVGLMIPVSYATELLHFSAPDDLAKLLANMMNHNLGFITIGMVAPLAEEMVFRGAVLRTLNEVLGHRLRWVAIAVSALLFAVVHGNMAQGFGAFVLGLALGWMYVRTGSIVPGVVFHWVNNGVAVLVFRLMPGTADMTLTEFYGGDTRRIAATICFSLMIAGAALYQLHWRLGKE